MGNARWAKNLLAKRVANGRHCCFQTSARLVFQRQWPAREGLHEDLHILAGSNEPVMDLLAPESAPARAFGPVAVGGLRETAFQEVTSPSVITPGLHAGGLRAGTLHKFVFAVSGDATTVRRGGALVAQWTRCAHAFAGKIFGGLSFWTVAPRFGQHARVCNDLWIGDSHVGMGIAR